MKYVIISGLSALLAILALGGCYKRFDPKSYAPEFSVSGFSGSDQIAPGHLVGYWAFDGELTDSVSGTSGENTGTSFANGFKGQALQGALNSYVLASPASALTAVTSLTLSLWVNTPPPSTGIIDVFSLTKTDGFWGNIEVFFENGSSNDNGKVRTHLYNGSADMTFASDGVVNLFDRWVNMTITYDAGSSTYKLYVNGAVVSTITQAGFGPLKMTNAGKIVFGAPPFMTTPSQTSGASAQGWASFLTGQLDEVRVYDKALTPEEVNALVVLQGKGK